MNGISHIMARIGQIQSMASRVDSSFDGGFAATLGSAASAAPPTVEAGPVPGSSMPTAAPTSADLLAEPPSGGTGLPAGAQRWQPAIERAAAANGVDPQLLNALVWVESGFDPTAVSHAGAIGLTQLMPATADALRVDPYDPNENLDGGARFLGSMIDRFGRVDLALAAYYAGPARVASSSNGSGVPPVAEQYVSAVLDRYTRLGDG